MVMGSRGFGDFAPNTEKTQLEMLMEVMQETQQDVATLRDNQNKLLDLIQGNTNDMGVLAEAVGENTDFIIKFAKEE